MIVLSDVSVLRILELFSEKYDLAYNNHSSSKLHLDAAKAIIDGPRHRWLSVVLLDTILGYSTRNFRMTVQELNKRKFNQYAVF